MPKNIEDIVVSTKKKSIRDIPMPENRRVATRGRRATDKEVIVEEEEAENVEIRVADEPALPRLHTERPTPKKRKRIPGKGTFVSLGIAGAVLLFAILSVFGGATLSYTPKSAPLTFNDESFTAFKTGEGELIFSVVKLSGDKGAEVSATGEQDVERKASGTIVVYNNASTEPQKLVENTRFETADGKVYRIPVAITIPGRKTVGGVTEPGSVETPVTADQPGAQYNIGLSDFTLPGLKGTPRYTTIYARSKSPMAGGFVGKEKGVDPEALAQAEAELESDLRSELASQAKAQVPEDFVIFPSLSTVVFDTLPQTEATGSKVTINKRGNFYGVMFKKSDLASYLASEKIKLGQNDVVDIPSLESLNVSFDGQAPSELLSATQVNFKVGGSALLVWKTNEETLKKDLLGREKSDVSSILNNYPSIVSADAVVRPFWKSAFPLDAGEISIKRESVQ